MYRCHYCGNLETEAGEESYFNCNSPHGELCGGCEKLRLLNKQILDAKAALEDLLNQRRELKSKLNHQHKSMIHRLPVEISSLIFEFYVVLAARISDTRGGLVLGAVCHTWRQIAWSSPRLWTRLDIDFGPSIKETHIQLVIEWLGRSGRLPLSISIDLESKPDGFPEELLSILFEGINNCSSRCYSLFLADCHLLTTPVLDPHATSSFQFDHPSFDWGSLINFSASSIFLDELFDIIQQAPQLMQCDFEAISNRSPLFIDGPVPICHSHIKSIGIEFGDEPMEVFLETITLPSLTELSLKVFHEELPTQAFVSFLTRSLCHLQDLSIHNATVTDEELVRVLRATSSLTSLKLGSLWTESAIPLVPFYRALAAHLPTTNGRSHTVAESFLPLLMEFVFTGGAQIPWKLIPNFFVPLNETPGAPRRPLARVCINCNQRIDEPIHYISKETLCQLQDFIDEGVCIILQLHVGNTVTSEDLIQLSIKRLEESKENE
ncbi:hypothetical protein GALMADRAFT_261608 [Galerina marginata CBS 339.88]|uniref:F-box domain-containing protein n=1 Tax=Galerina marginata (strain CBS 339.88) TaxID=685588 RepID=A0A067TUJ3_GALM3|nr:hypothetical protein GALMADRAFT_261608 [Galerina marginata CBS 339.88]